MLDVRFQKQFRNRFTLYLEPAPFLSRRAFYNFTILEVRTKGKLALGFESENVHQPGRDSIGAGPRVSYAFPGWKGFTSVVAVAYQFRRQEKDALRLYLMLNRRFKR